MREDEKKKTSNRFACVEIPWTSYWFCEFAALDVVCDSCVVSSVCEVVDAAATCKCIQCVGATGMGQLMFGIAMTISIPAIFIISVFYSLKNGQVVVGIMIILFGIMCMIAWKYFNVKKKRDAERLKSQMEAWEKQEHGALAGHDSEGAHFSTSLPAFAPVANLENSLNSSQVIKTLKTAKQVPPPVQPAMGGAATTDNNGTKPGSRPPSPGPTTGHLHTNHHGTRERSRSKIHNNNVSDAPKTPSTDTLGVAPSSGNRSRQPSVYQTKALEVENITVTQPQGSGGRSRQSSVHQSSSPSSQPSPKALDGGTASSRRPSEHHSPKSPAPQDFLTPNTGGGGGASRASSRRPSVAAHDPLL